MTPRRQAPPGTAQHAIRDQDVRSGLRQRALRQRHGLGMDDQTVVVVQNSNAQQDQAEGVRRTIYPVTEVRVSGLGLTAETDTGTLSVVQAPCVCGAGPTATAWPVMPDVGKKVDLQPMDSMPDWIRPAATL